MNVIHQFRRYLIRPHVRPWALLTPILVLLACLPLLRPLRHPDPREISDDELARLATIESLVDRRTLAIESSAFTPSTLIVRTHGHLYSAQTPTLSFLLAGPYWVMQRFGLNFTNHPALVAYLLTLIGAAIPVAAAAGLVYRMGRLFELPRQRRTLLALTTIFGGGLVSYGVVLNSHAPAAALVLASAACIIHVAIGKSSTVTSGWLAISGLCAAFAAVIDPSTVIFIPLFAIAIPLLRWRWPKRIGGLAMYTLGLAPALVLHTTLMLPITGNALPAALHPELTGTQLVSTSASLSGMIPDDADDLSHAPTWWDLLGVQLSRLTAAFFGDHGIFTHFPVLILGLFGVAAVMHRHWPMTTKMLAIATVLGVSIAIVIFCLITLLGPGAMFGPQAFIAFLPLTLFWSGAWMRRPHPPVKWSMAGGLLIFSVIVTLLGATHPYPRDGYDRYTVAQAVTNLLHPIPLASPAALAER